MDFPILYNSCGEEQKPSLVFNSTDIRSTVVSGESEAGYTINFPRYTRSKKKFMVYYNFVENSVFDTISTFFNESAIGMANLFNWTHPVSGIVYTVRFNNDNLSRNINKNENYSTFKFELLEV